MPLTPPAPRKRLHMRSIECTGYLREDGLFDIEGHLVDVKSYAFPNRHRGEIKAEEPLHEMWLRLTLDADLLVHAAEAWTVHGPFGHCDAINHAYRALAGLRIGPGWRKAVKARVGGALGCTHITELLSPLATTAYQTIHGRQEDEDDRKVRDPSRKPFFIDSCHILSSAGELVRTSYPKWYTRNTPTDSGTAESVAADTRSTPASEVER